MRSISQRCTTGNTFLIARNVLRTTIFAPSIHHPFLPKVLELGPFLPCDGPSNEDEDDGKDDKDQTDEQEAGFSQKSREEKSEGKETHHAGETVEQYSLGLGVRIGVIIDRGRAGQVSPAFRAEPGPRDRFGLAVGALGHRSRGFRSVDLILSG
jgi:hypothetical protein